MSCVLKSPNWLKTLSCKKNLNIFEILIARLVLIEQPEQVKIFY